MNTPELFALNSAGHERCSVVMWGRYLYLCQSFWSVNYKINQMQSLIYLLLLFLLHVYYSVILLYHITKKRSRIAFISSLVQKVGFFGRWCFPKDDLVTKGHFYDVSRTLLSIALKNINNYYIISNNIKIHTTLLVCFLQLS